MRPAFEFTVNDTFLIEVRGLILWPFFLLAVAIMSSIERGAGGRIWLESLPGATGFYESWGMVRQPGPSAEGNWIYTLTPATAEQLLAEIKEKGIIIP